MAGWPKLVEPPRTGQFDVKWDSILCYTLVTSISFWVRPPIKSRKLTQNSSFHSNDWLFIGGFISTFLISTPTHPCLSIFFINHISYFIYFIYEVVWQPWFSYLWKNQDVSGNVRTFMYGDGSCLEDHPTNRKWLPWLVSSHAVDFPFFSHL